MSKQETAEVRRGGGKGGIVGQGDGGDSPREGGKMRARREEKEE